MEEDHSLLESAIALAVNAHCGRTDKGGAPYILHLLRVMLGLNGPREMMAGVLHDVVEDSGLTAGVPPSGRLPPGGGATGGGGRERMTPREASSRSTGRSTGARIDPPPAKLLATVDSLALPGNRGTAGPPVCGEGQDLAYAFGRRIPPTDRNGTWDSSAAFLPVRWA